MSRGEILNDEMLDHIVSDYFDSDESKSAIGMLSEVYERLQQISIGDEKCYIGDSKNGLGKGVFAKCNIKKGEAITVVPVHLLLIDRNGKKLVYPSHAMDIYDTGERWIIDRKFTIVSDRNFFENPNQLGHMLNEFSRPKSSLFTDALTYLDQSKEGNNAEDQVAPFSTDFESGSITVPIVIVFATKDINAGEEILRFRGI